MGIDDEPPRRRTFSGLPTPPTPPSGGPHRMVFRLIGIPILAVAGVLLYKGIRDRFFLPECDSQHARETLAEVLKQFNLEQLRYEPLRTVSTSQREVVCSAVLPLPDGSSVNVDYTFVWQGDKVNMRYSVARKPAQGSALPPRSERTKS
jgi:hypothetical protein